MLLVHFNKLDPESETQGPLDDCHRHTHRQISMRQKEAHLEIVPCFDEYGGFH
jgi:hypothetical protein